MTPYFKMATVQEKAMCLLWFFETKSVIKTQRRYRTQYGKDPPSDNAIRRWLNQCQETGSVLHRKGAGRLSTSKEDVDRIQEAFSRSLQKSTRRTSLQIGVTQTTLWMVVHNRLHPHAYEVQIVQALKPDDIPRRFQFAKDILSNVKAHENYLRRWIFSDEATFYVSGRVNRYNCKICWNMLENTWREIEYRLDILRAMKGAHVEVI
jgi:hypothetical protein